MLETVYEMQLGSGEEVVVRIKAIYTPTAVRPYGFYAEMLDQNGNVLDSATTGELFITEAEAVAEMKLISQYQVTPCTLCDIF